MQIVGMDAKAIARGEDFDSVEDKNAFEVDDSLQERFFDFLNVDCFAGLLVSTTVIVRFLNSSWFSLI
jgi:hypothetical protein